MKVAIFGSRNLGNNEAVKAVWNRFRNQLPQHITLLHGGAKGPQNDIVEIEQDNPNTDIVLFKPWHMINSRLPFDRNLFFYRNKQIIDNSDMVVFVMHEDSKQNDAELRLAFEYYNSRYGKSENKSHLIIKQTLEDGQDVIKSE